MGSLTVAATASSSGSAMVCAGRKAMRWAFRRASLPESGWAVRRITRPPAARATAQMAPTVENPPGPAEARRRSPGDAGGVVTSPTTWAERPSTSSGEPCGDGDGGEKTELIWWHICVAMLAAPPLCSISVLSRWVGALYGCHSAGRWCPAALAARRWRWPPCGPP
ncbi:unnamed protein product [Spirodela intermedia]|uniref:Uncharacterized protein n=1 Tax=Spirodela intermedia TaxID=51605 RepID=A0A7I8L2Y0_SPIIN|nr:unnamed protein product [Spirodela intermedia]